MTEFFRDELDELDRKELEEVVSDYGRGLVPLVVPSRSSATTCDATGWATSKARSSRSHPKELGLRTHV